MSQTGKVLMEEGARLETMAPRSGMFFVAIVILPVALVWPFFAPRSLWTWAIVAAGALVSLDCLRRLRVSYRVSTGEIACCGMLKTERIAWPEVEAVGIHTIRSRYGIVGVGFSLYADRRLMRVKIATRPAEEFKRKLERWCPRALWVDEDGGTFDVPSGVAAERVRALVARHARRLRRKHGAVIILTAGIVAGGVLVAAPGLCRGEMSWREEKVLLFAAIWFACMCGHHLRALWRLRK